MEYHGEKDTRLLSRYILKNRCIVVSRRVRNISEYVLKELQIGFSTSYTEPGLVRQVLLKTAGEYCEHEKSVKNVRYALTSLGLSCLQI